jgi:hypothetical protein
VIDEVSMIFKTYSIRNILATISRKQKQELFTKDNHEIFLFYKIQTGELIPELYRK